MNFGPHSSEADSHAIMDAAVANGINLVDTANVYGRHLGVGATEEILGRWVAKGGGRRDKVVLATKVYGTMGDWPNEAHLSKLAIIHQCEESLRRLGTDRIDLYQMHHIDREAWWDEIWEAMEQLKRTGKILYVGSSNFAGWHIARANEIAGYRHSLGLATEQSLYNLTARTLELEVIPAVPRVRHGPDLVQPARGRPARRGALQGRGRAARHRVHARRDRGEPVRSSRPGRSSAPSSGEDPAHVALAWLLHQPVVTAPIIGPRTESSCCTRCTPSTSSSTTTCSRGSTRSSPGPGGPAPEAYAW